MAAGVCAVLLVGMFAFSARSSLFGLLFSLVTVGFAPKRRADELTAARAAAAKSAPGRS